MSYDTMLHLHNVTKIKISKTEIKFESNGRAYYVKDISIFQGDNEIKLAMFSENGDCFEFNESKRMKETQH